MNKVIEITYAANQTGKCIHVDITRSNGIVGGYRNITKSSAARLVAAYNHLAQTGSTARPFANHYLGLTGGTLQVKQD